MPDRQAFHPIHGADPNDGERAVITQLKEHFAELRAHITGALPANRERALALTHLEDSCMRAVRSVLEGQPPARP